MSKDIWMAGENILNKARMGWKIYFMLSVFFMVLFLIVFAFVSYYLYHVKIFEYFVYILMKVQDKINHLHFIYGYYCDKFGSGNMCKFMKVSKHIIYQTGYLDAYGRYLIRTGLKAGLISVIISGIIYYFTVYKYFSNELKEMTEEKELRGRKVLQDESEVDERYKRKDNVLFITDRIKLGIDDCLTHILILGSSGSGKSSLIHRQLELLRNSNYRVIIMDFKGEFLQKWYCKDTDLIFNPLDTRSVKWTVTNDITKIDELNSFVNTFIAEAKGENKIWSDWGRNVLKAIMLVAFLEKRTTNRDIISYLTMSQEQLYKLFDQYKHKHGYIANGMTSLGGENTKQGQGVLSMLSNTIDALSLLEDGLFSFRQFVRSTLKQDSKGWLFIENGERNVGQENIFSSVLDILSNEALKLSEANGQLRLLFFIDEWGRYFRSESIERLVTLGRSKGVSLVFANQDLSKIKYLYREEMDTLFNSISTLICLKINDYFTQKYISDSIGEIEVERNRESVTMSPADVRDSLNISKEITRKQAILSSELGTLKKGQMIVRFSDGNVLKTSFKYKKYDNVLSDDELLVAKDLNISNLIK